MSAECGGRGDGENKKGFLKMCFSNNTNRVVVRELPYFTSSHPKTISAPSGKPFAAV